MTFAQNFEDVMLNRIFSGDEPGFYIDIGAWDPEIDSVTKHFYDKGWHGINVEPNIRFFNRLVKARQRDLNLNVAVGKRKGQVNFREVVDFELSRLSTISDESGLNVDFVEYEVPLMTLGEICASYAHDVSIDFLKIDVEGAERDVLVGGDWRLFRPKIVIIEATLPNTPIPCHEEWEDIMTAAGYTFLYFDGLNRFYTVEEERDRYSSLFQVPPCVHDRFIRPAELRADQLAKANTDLKEQITNLKVQVDRCQDSLRETYAQIAELQEKVRVKEAIQQELNESGEEIRRLGAVIQQMQRRNLLYGRALTGLQYAVRSADNKYQAMHQRLQHMERSRSWRYTKVFRWLWARKFSRAKISTWLSRKRKNTNDR